MGKPFKSDSSEHKVGDSVAERSGRLLRHVVTYSG